MSVGFIGLGNMGGHMARNLMKSGKKLVVFDVNKATLEQFKADGAIVANHPADVAAACKDIVTVLPSSPHVKQVFTGDNGIFKEIQEGTLCMDASTIDQAASIEISKLCLKHKSFYVDNPMSGGTNGALNGTLTFMVGSGNSDSVFERAKKTLELMGKNIVDVGAVGNGQAVKICNNMLLGIQMLAVAETMNLGMSMGLDKKQLTAILNTSTGRCFVSELYHPVPGVSETVPSSKGYAGGFGTALMAKDLSLAQNASTTSQAPTPLGSLTHQFYRMMAKNPKFEAKDFSVIYQYIKDGAK